jgi:hypothetical protein
VQRDQLVRGVPAREAKELGEVAELAPRRERSRLRAADLGLAAGRAYEAAGDLDQGRLPGAVGTEQADQLALRDVDVHAGERRGCPVPLLEASGGERSHMLPGTKNFE